MTPRWQESDLEVTHLKGSGPGGQNRNKRLTGVRVKHLPTGIVVVATERRSQLQNLEAALERLDQKLEALFHKPKPRRPTKKTKASDRRRFEEKHHRSKVKSLRGRVHGSDG